MLAACVEPALGFVITQSAHAIHPWHRVPAGRKFRILEVPRWTASYYVDRLLHVGYPVDHPVSELAHSLVH